MLRRPRDDGPQRKSAGLGSTASYARLTAKRRRRWASGPPADAVRSHSKTRTAPPLGIGDVEQVARPGLDVRGRHPVVPPLVLGGRATTAAVET